MLEKYYYSCKIKYSKQKLWRICLQLMHQPLPLPSICHTWISIVAWEVISTMDWTPCNTTYLLAKTMPVFWLPSANLVMMFRSSCFAIRQGTGKSQKDHHCTFFSMGELKSTITLQFTNERNEDHAKYDKI